MEKSVNKTTYQDLLDRLIALEERMSQLEKRLSGQTTAPVEEEPLPPLIPEDAGQKAASLELHIGEFWLSKAGIIALVIGIAFLLALPYENYPPILPGLLGYAIAGGIFALSYYWRQSYNLLSRYLLGGGLVLLYFTTLRLHFLGDRPFVTSRGVELGLLLLMVGVSLAVSLRRKSVYLTSVSLLMGFVTALLSDQPLFQFLLVGVLAVTMVYCKLKFHWQNLLIFGITGAYFTHLLWFLNNPILGNNIEFVSSPQYNLYFLLVYMLIFASGNLLREKNTPEDNALIVSTFLNCFLGYGLFLLLTISKFQDHFTLHHLLASVLFLALAVFFWIREKSRYSTFFYAMLGYGALSVAIISDFAKPDFFVWLCWQSLLVVSTAIWFRSRFIIVANFLIYTLLFFAYLALAGEAGTISLSFGIVALLSARILNWKKERLELKTELMRNAYLAAAFITFPYGLYKLVPGGYVSLSWVGVSVLYYLIGRLLNNQKYRWLALLTLLLTVIRVFAVDTVNLSPDLRVASFLVLGIVLVLGSIIYTRMRKSTLVKKDVNDQSSN